MQYKQFIETLAASYDYLAQSGVQSGVYLSCTRH